MFQVRTLLCAIALASVANAVVYRPNNNMVYQRRQDASATAMAQAASTTKPSPPFNFGNPSSDYPGVVADGSRGPTNPDKPMMDTPVNQTSDARLASINSADDWCTFGPLDLDLPVSDQEERTVAWCTKPRNNARVIPDGTLTAVHFVKTPLYVQVMALGDFTKIGIKANDSGGELDPHGQYGGGNPKGGDVTSNVTGKDVFYKEWMNYVGHDIMCFRVCTAGSDQAKPGVECEHELDKMGCPWVMPGDYSPDVFDSCDADPAYPPGYFLEDGSTSTFQQYMTGLWTLDGKELTFTNGHKGQSTPSVAQSMPKSSNCKPVPSPANKIASLSKSAESSVSQAAAAVANDGDSKSSSSDKRGNKNENNSESSGKDSGSSDKKDRTGADNVSVTLASTVALAVGTLAAAFLL